MFGGDQVSAGEESGLTLFISSQETVRFAAETKARLTRDGDHTVVSLEQGTVAFRSTGQTRVVLEGYEVIARGRAGVSVVAQVALSDARKARVWAVRGAVEVTSADQTVLLQPGESAVIVAQDQQAATAADGGEEPSDGQETAEAAPGSLAGTLVDQTRTVVRGARVTLTSSTGAMFSTLSDQLGAFSFENLPPGTYTLRVTKSGLPRFEMPGVQVTSGQASALGIVTMRGGGGSNSGVIIAVVAAAVGGGLGAALALGGGGDGTTAPPPPPISPSNP